MARDSIILGTFSDVERAKAAIEDLHAAGYGASEISVLMQDKKQAQELAKDTGSSVGKGAATGAGVGVVTGGLAGLALALSAVVIPGVGPFLVAGPLASALGLSGAAAATATGAVTGGVAGGVVGALIGLGVPHKDATAYEALIRRGEVLVSVPVKATDASRIMAIFKGHKANAAKEVFIDGSGSSDRRMAST